MVRLGQLAIAHPRRTIAAWAAVIGVLALLGMGVADRLHRGLVLVPGTESSRAARVTTERFGERNTLLVLLRGPRPELDRQGERLSAKLDSYPDLAVLAPWTPGAKQALRPRPDAALLVVRADRPFEEVSRVIVPRVRSDVHRFTTAPVKSSVSGFADLAEGLHDASVAAAHRAETLATPLLLLILLLVFRSPIAALLPLGIGLTTIRAAGGVLDLVNRADALDAFAFNMASVMGLALGVDYALVLVSRFREELAAGHDSPRAARIAVQTAGHTVVYAGLAVALAMLGALLVAPGNLLASATVGVLASLVIALLGALTALPAALTLLGPAVNRWRIGGAREGKGRLAGWALRAIRRPVVAVALVGGLIAALAAPALALTSGAPDPRTLPPDSPVRIDFNQLQVTAGSGWTVPYEITVTSPRGAVTDRRTLEALARWQARTARRDDVQSVLGPAGIAKRSRAIDRTPAQLARLRPELQRGLRDQRRLARGLAQAGGGARQLRAGLGQAAAASRLIAAGQQQGAAGAARLAAGVNLALSAAKRLKSGARAASAGAGLLSRGALRSAGGAKQLADGLALAQEGLAKGLPQVHALAQGLKNGAADLARLRQPAQLADSSLDTALHELDGMLPTSKADPAYRRVRNAVVAAKTATSGRNPDTGAQAAAGYSGLDAALASASGQAGIAASGAQTLASRLDELDAGLRKLSSGANRLRDGGNQLGSGAGQLDSGLGRLANGNSALVDGLGKLSAGGGALAGGTVRLSQGTQQLGNGLADGAVKTSALTVGVDRMHAGVVGAEIRTKRLGAPLKGTKRLAETLDSGYFLLAALDTASAGQRQSSTFAVNLERGGTAAQMTVIPDLGKKDVRALGRLRAYLHSSLAGLKKQTGVDSYLGGPAAVVQDFNSETSGRYILLALVLAGTTFLALVVMLRSLLLPLIAVTLNLLTIGAAFGVLTFLFEGNPAPLGGPGYLDAVSIFMIFAVAFGLSIDYEVFMLARMREGYALTGDTDRAISYGLRHTAHVVTGGALIMSGVFIASAVSAVSSIRQVGVALTIAVLLDSTLIRLVLLPAAMRVLGDRIWSEPRWITRLRPSRTGTAAADGSAAGLGNGALAGAGKHKHAVMPTEPE